MGMSRVRVTIDELVLTGLDPIQRQALVEGLRAELSRVLRDPVTRSGVRSNRTPVVRLGRLPLEPGAAGGRKFGGALAHSIGRKLKPPRGPQ
jgi:hypothetical protein